MVKCFLATSDQRYRQSYPFYLSRSFLKVMDVSRIKLFPDFQDLLPDLLQTVEIISVQKEEKHQDEVNCGDVLHTWGGRQQRRRMEAPHQMGSYLCCKARSHASVGACVHVATRPSLSAPAQSKEEPQEVHHPPAQFSATGVEGGVALHLQGVQMR